MQNSSSHALIGGYAGAVMMHSALHTVWCFFFFNDTATTEIYTLSLHDALPISPGAVRRPPPSSRKLPTAAVCSGARRSTPRSEEHTSELQSRRDLVCRLLL